MSITKTNPAKNFKRAKRIALKQSALMAKPKGSRVEKAISLAGREKKLVDIANYHCIKGKAKSTMVRAIQKRQMGCRELVRI
ncbi:hypothetical protein [Rodentibacter genomosp. 2]|uniref:Uncharacterized protein n=1 Tax=Rodentibacter genomosp. 2 TaxID=1908266 RepID=A0A1V3JNE7_9PAST|nr:hypothetical protein [Rodentibacter genomosp. 2]OOF58301.1 hypothetical protein BKK55_02725 [Rodentibacter genomosp. 2]